MSMMGPAPDLDLNTIVYATDFSIYSQNAAVYAAFLARSFSAKLLLAHAFILSQAAAEVEVDPALTSLQRRDLQTLLSQKAASMSHGSVHADPVLLEGDPGTVLPELANRCAPSIIVLGTHGGSWVEREVIGSVAERILRSTSWPALTVGPHIRSAPEDRLRFERILYATDFTPAAARAAIFAVSFATAFRASIDILNVVQGESVDHPDRLAETRDHFYHALDQLVPEQAKDFCHPRTFVEVGAAHDQILRHIEDRAIDLLVLGLRKSSHLGIETRRSAAFQLIIQAACPVLTLIG